MKKKTIGLFIISFCALLAVAGIISFFTVRFFISDFNRPGPQPEKKMQFVIPRGESLSSIAHRLEHSGIIRNAYTLIIAGRKLHVEKRIKAGRYLLSSRLSPREILERIESGRVIQYRFNVPEGLTIDQYAQKWETDHFGTAEEFITAVKKYKNSKLQTPPTGWEGYLFPDTYFFPNRTSAQKVVSMMVNNFASKFLPYWNEKKAAMDLTLHEIVTLASLIEKETNLASERPIISSVFHNRLKYGMLLQCDPTVAYALGKAYSGKLTRKDLQIDNAFNTYKYAGLPPGPIANPGLQSLMAACDPQQTDFLYFVVKRNGGHTFSKSLAEHNIAVQRYRRDMRKKHKKSRK